MRVKDEMQSLYLTLYVDKIVVLVANRFIQNILKSKKLPETAFQVLHMDLIELKDTLLSMVKTDQSITNLYHRHLWKRKNQSQISSLCQ